MLQGRIVIASALAIVIACPIAATPARAQFPGRLFGALTAPFRMMLRGPHLRYHHAHRHRDHRSSRVVHRRMPVQGNRTATAAGVTAGVGGAAVGATAIEPARRESNARSAPADRSAGSATAGSTFWPSASPSTYEDMLGYALWPNDYERPFWSHGPGDIMQAMTAPTTAFASAGAKAQPRRPQAANAADQTAACVAREQQQAFQPLDRVPDAIELNDAQRQALEELRNAVRAAIVREAASCRTGIPASQPERLRSMIDALWSMRYAEFRIRTALRTFYDSLDSDQKARFGAEPQTVGSSAQVAASGPAAICGGQLQQAGANPFQPLERSLQLSGEQLKNFQMLYGASIDMAKFLASSCPEETPATPMARLDAAGDRIMSLLHAATTIEPMLGQFYGSLSDDQRARFNTAAR